MVILCRGCLEEGFLDYMDSRENCWTYNNTRENLSNGARLPQRFEQEVEDMGDDKNPGYLHTRGDHGINGVDRTTHYRFR